MSAIEVLKKMIAVRDTPVKDSFESGRVNALKEAVLALEQKEKLIGWLKEKSKFGMREAHYGYLTKADEAYYNCIEEVLERISEEK